jgi:hypothetical protein
VKDQTSNVRIVGKGTLELNIDAHLTYIQSAQQIAEVCKGISLYLDELFNERYNQALQNLKALIKERS